MSVKNMSKNKYVSSYKSFISYLNKAECKIIKLCDSFEIDEDDIEKFRYEEINKSINDRISKSKTLFDQGFIGGVNIELKESDRKKILEAIEESKKQPESLIIPIGSKLKKILEDIYEKK